MAKRLKTQFVDGLDTRHPHSHMHFVGIWWLMPSLRLQAVIYKHLSVGLGLASALGFNIFGANSRRAADVQSCGQSLPKCTGAREPPSATPGRLHYNLLTCTNQMTHRTGDPAACLQHYSRPGPHHSKILKFGEPLLS